jgi:uncharacterized SAM-binding protein YcdF (DUF218 family)
MSFFLDKLISVFVFPLGFSLTACVLLLVLGGSGWIRAGKTSIALAVLGLWVASMPLVATYALRTLEKTYPLLSVSETPSADVIIVLGGGVRPPNGDNPFPDFGDASDRIVHGLRLLLAGKAQKILLVGAGNGWGSDTTSEGGAMSQVLQDLGVDAGAILIEEQSRNTFENALYAKQIWDREGFTSGLLVTSALHMRRAADVFRKRHFSITPVPIDARAGALETMMLLSILPDVRALEQTTFALKEWLGLLVYKIRGWV